MQSFKVSKNEASSKNHADTNGAPVPVVTTKAVVIEKNDVLFYPRCHATNPFHCHLHESAKEPIEDKDNALIFQPGDNYLIMETGVSGCASITLLFWFIVSWNILLVVIFSITAFICQVRFQSLSTTIPKVLQTIVPYSYSQAPLTLNSTGPRGPTRRFWSVSFRGSNRLKSFNYLRCTPSPDRRKKVRFNSILLNSLEFTVHFVQSEWHLISQRTVTFGCYMVPIFLVAAAVLTSKHFLSAQFQLWEIFSLANQMLSYSGCLWE